MTHKDQQLELLKDPNLGMKILQEQLAVIHELTAPMTYPWETTANGQPHGLHSDDGMDYLCAALALGNELMDLFRSGDIDGLLSDDGTQGDKLGFATWLNEKADPDHEDSIQNYACDGVCDTLWFLCMTDEELTELDNDELAAIDNAMRLNAE